MKMPNDFREFARLRQDVEAVIQRIGHNTWDCVLLDVDGNWTRAVFFTEEQAQDACRELEVRWHEGWEDARLARRMNRRDHWGQPGGQRRAI
jgi:hypothetical protein